MPTTRSVISSSHAFAVHARPREDAAYVCYCYTPFRYAWYERDNALQQVPGVLRPAVDHLLTALALDQSSAVRRFAEDVRTALD